MTHVFEEQIEAVHTLLSAHSKCISDALIWFAGTKGIQSDDVRLKATFDKLKASEADNGHVAVDEFGSILKESFSFIYKLFLNELAIPDIADMRTRTQKIFENVKLQKLDSVFLPDDIP
jgi:hypothetical protein